MYKLHEIAIIILFGLIIGLAMYLGLVLDDKAQEIKENSWERFEEIDNAIK